MYRALSIMVLALALVACGGSDDGNGDTASSATSTTAVSGSTSATAAPTNPAAAPTTPTGAADTTTATTEAADAPTAEASSSDSEDPNRPDFHIPLAAGSSVEVESGDPDALGLEDELGTVKVTIIDIKGKLPVDIPELGPEPGNQFWGIDAKVEATSDKQVNTGVWTVLLADGSEHDSGYIPSVENVIYRRLAPGETLQGLIMFEIPEDAVVTAIKMTPSIYVGGNVFFDAS